MKKLLAVFAMTMLFVSGCSFTGGSTIIKVNGEAISEKQFEETFESLVGSSPFFGSVSLKEIKKAAEKDNENMLYSIFKDKAVNELIYTTLLEQEIKRRNIVATEADYEKELNYMIEILGSKSALNDFLRERGISPVEFKKATMQKIRMSKLAASISKIEVSDEEVANYYKNRKKAFSYPEKVRASHILVLADEKEYAENLKKKYPEITDADLDARVKAEMEARKKKAEAILAEVKNSPKDFAKIAKVKSDDRTSAKMGGELGFFSRKDMVKPFSDAAFSLPVNKVSDLVKTRYGYHIILVTDRTEAGVYPFEKVKKEIGESIKSRKEMKVIDDLATALKNAAVVEYVNKEYETSEFQKMIDAEMQAAEAEGK